MYGQTQECSQWAAYSPVDWITVEAAPLAGQPSAFVGVSANPSTQSRSATLIIAGIRLAITQEGAVTIAPRIEGNVLANGTFDKDLASWGWPARFNYPNAPGVPVWSQLDANGSLSSGSILLRDTDQNPTQSFQQLQCVPITTGFGLYEFGATLRVGSSDGEGALGFIIFASTDCSGTPVGGNSGRNVPILGPQDPGVWRKVQFTQLVPSSVRSAMLVLASGANNTPLFETWFDDAFIRKLQ